MAPPAVQFRDSHLARHLAMAPAYGWITWKRLRGRLGGARRRPRCPLNVLPHQHQPSREGGQPGLRQLAVVGDSLATGCGDPVSGLTLVGWADRLALALWEQCPQMGYTNLGVDGLTTAQIAAGQLEAVRAIGPDLIILSAGGNDLLARRWDPAAFRRAYTELLAGLTGTGATVLTSTWHDVPRAVSMPAALAERYSHRLAEASAIVREVSAALGAVCVDFWQMPELLDASCYSADGTHPNARGYLRAAGVLAGVVAGQTGIAIPLGALYHRGERRAAPAAQVPIAWRMWVHLGFGAGRREVGA